MLPCAMGLTCREAMAIFSENTTLQLSREACLLQRDLDYYQRRVQELETALYNAECVLDEHMAPVIPLEFVYTFVAL